MSRKRSRNDSDEGLQRFLSAFDLWDTFRALPQELRSMIRNARRPRLGIDWGWDGPRDRRDRALKTEAERAVSRALTLLDENADPVLVQDCFAWGWPLSGLLAWCLDEPEFAANDGVQRLAETLLVLRTDECMDDVIDGLCSAVDRKLQARSSPMDQPAYWLDLHIDPERGLRARLLRQDAEVRDLVVDGKAVRAFRCRTVASNHGVENARVSRSVFEPGDGEADMWITAHALRRIDERLPTAIRELWHLMVTTSLHKPVLAPAPQGGPMLKCHLAGNAIGYAPVAPATDGSLVLKTFLFVTMEGTPEGDRLKRLLGTRREDLKYLELDRLQTFVDTDIGTDTSIRTIMEEAGCSHLFELDLRDPEELIRGHAAEARRYLRLEDGGASPAAAALRAALKAERS